MNKQITDSLKKILNGLNTRIEKLANYDSVKSKRPLGYDQTSSEIQASMADSQKMYTAMASENAAQFSKLFKAVDTNTKNIEGLRGIVFDNLDRKIFTKEDFENPADVTPEELQKVDLRYDPETNRMHSTREEDKNKMVSFDDARQKLADQRNNEILQKEEPDAIPILGPEIPDAKPAVDGGSDQEIGILSEILEGIKKVNDNIKTLMGQGKDDKDAEKEKKPSLLSRLKGISGGKKDGKEKNPLEPLLNIIDTVKNFIQNLIAAFVFTALPTLITLFKEKKEWIEENITTPVLDFFMETLPEFFGSVVKVFTETIPTKIQEAGNWISNKVTSIGDAISGWVAGVRDKLASIMESIAGGISSIGEVGKKIGNKILGFAAKIKAGAADIAKSIISQPEQTDKGDASKASGDKSKGNLKAEDVPEATKIKPDEIKRLRKIEDIASRTNDEFQLVDLAKEYLNIIGKEANDENVLKLVNNWLDKYYGDGYSSGAVGKDPKTGQPKYFSMVNHNQERTQRNHERYEAGRAKVQEAAARSRGEQVAAGSMAATDPSVGVASKSKDGRTVIPGGRTGMSGTRTASKGQKFQIDMVPNPTPDLSSIKDQIFYVGKEAA